MIVTLTANPSLDRTVVLTGPLERGTVQRAATALVDPGGKGINVARVLHGAGRPVLAVLPANTGDPLLAALDDRGIPYCSVPTSGPARTNITIAEPDGTTTKLNEPGTDSGEATITGLLAAVADNAAGATWAVLSGSLPPGVPDGWYADVVRALRSTHCRIAVDTSEGPLLALAAQFPEAAPDVIKPNTDELAQLTGADAASLEAAVHSGDLTPVVTTARSLVERGVGAVLATLGGAGAVLVSSDGAWRAVPPPVVARSTVGAGDSSLAGFLLAEQAGLGPADRLRHAVAYGSAAVALPGTELPGPVDATVVQVTDLDIPARSLPHP
ncbi:1-phosphofructokinase family hexose kinase [Rhodococcus chondri]|uniref:1-phosphofructokinase family hexose kinase n=1 Tax=Rhodococcus chondri TaxID=3065941 RepID=A0ABU7JZ59_9NOCA|nr:1-phosphofructokinase family hexose kinase [Rhodococcus sp. CC-R104]MEE2035288.1 1-phosphofructokinase family hexose kinase [Rhodococcus sp. CC-R104]